MSHCVTHVTLCDRCNATETVAFKLNFFCRCIKYNMPRRFRKSRPIRRRKNVMRKRPFRKGRQFRKKIGLNHIRVKSLGLGTSFSKTFLRPNKFGSAMRKKYWLGAKRQYQKSVASFIEADGLSNFTQNYFAVNYFSPGDMNEALTAYAQEPGATGDNDNTARFYWNKVIAEILMTNSSNTNVMIDIYTFASKRDTLDSPAKTWYDSMQDQVSGTTLDITRQNYGISPLDAVGVTSQYKCYKVTHIMLSPGQSHKHSHTQHLCRPIGNEMLDEAVEGVQAALRGITHYDLIVARSATVESGTNNALAGISPMKLNYYFTKKYEYKYVFDNTTDFKYALPSEPTTGNAIYNQGSGASAAPVRI